MIRVVDASREDVSSLLRGRRIPSDSSLTDTVASIIDDVRRRGDEALLESARRFDSPELQSIECPIDRSIIVDPSLQEAYVRIRAFHDEQAARVLAGMPGGHWAMPDGTAGQRVLPLRQAGVYVPGGKASYPSSVLMNAVPAKSAGVANVVVTSPAMRDGSLPGAVLQAAVLAGVDQVFRIGGAAAIAAMALGTETVPQVEKIVGPGNRFVNEAKRQLWGTVGLDGYAGPSEVAVLADDASDPRFAAADLLTQIEHSEDNAAFLVCLSEAHLRAVLAKVELLLAGSAREATMRAALEGDSLAIVASSMEEACALIDEIAPEHLSLHVAEPEAAMARIHNAACILLGDMTPQSAADWVLGPSHTLPTMRAARFGNPVNVLDFLKVQNVSRLTRSQLAELLPTITALGRLEGFPMHARAAELRFE